MKIPGLPNFKIPLNQRIIAYQTAVWQLWLPLAVASLWMRLVAMYHVVYCERFVLDPFLRAVCSDLIIITLLCALTAKLLRWQWLRVAMALLYCVLLAANVDFISENDSNLDFAMADQAASLAFIVSTVFSKALGMKILQSAGIFLFFYWIVRRYSPNRMLIHYGFPLLIVMVANFWYTAPIGKNRAGWKQMNLVEDYTRNVLQAQALDTEIQTAAAKRFFTKDLSGAPVATFPAKPGTNVLMIVLESVGADHVKRGWLPFLRSLSKESLYYPNFYTNSANTINGEYSLLCADAPGLAIPRPGAVKPWALVKRKSPPLFCLPRLLASAGYTTVYMQPADLSFQRKGDFMPMIGFQEVYGRKELPDDSGAIPWGAWGPDDSQLYEHAIKRLKGLQSEGKPWFFNIMTISTHYPANVPESFQVDGITDANNRKRSSMFADQALEKFFAELKSMGIFENTLVIITNDEVRTSGNSTPEGLRRKNHGVMLAFTPQRDIKTIKDTHAQTDVFLSIAEYLGMPTEKIDIGRSLFREYNSFTPVFFGNFFTKYFLAMPNNKHLLLCSTNDLNCTQYKVTKGKDIFDATFQAVPRARAEYIAMMKQLVTKNHKRTPKLWEAGDAVNPEIEAGRAVAK